MHTGEVAPWKRRIQRCWIGFLVVAIAACGVQPVAPIETPPSIAASPSQSGASAKTPTDTTASNPTDAIAEIANYQGVLAATEFVVGVNRFPFGLFSSDGLQLKAATVAATFFNLNHEDPRQASTHPAPWREIKGSAPSMDHNDGQAHMHSENEPHLDSSGAYVVDEVQFDEPGNWGVLFEVRDGSASGQQPKGFTFVVKPASSVPSIGDKAPATQNLTIEDVASFEELSSSLHETRMHEFSVADALELNEPFVVVFATPGFCTSRMCGPVTSMAASLHESYGHEIPFIHIEPFVLPIARSEGRLVRGEAMREWNLYSEPWIFVVDGNGVISARFEGPVSAMELDAAVKKAEAIPPLVE